MALRKKINKNKNFIFYKKIIGFTTKKGKKSIATKLIYSAFLKVSLKINVPINLVFIQVFIKLNTFVETKKISIKRGSHIIPFGISFERRCYIISKWLLSSLKQSNQKISTSEKLSIEILNLIKDETLSKSFLEKVQNKIDAVSNRSNIHYRW